MGGAPPAGLLPRVHSVLECMAGREQKGIILTQIHIMINPDQLSPEQVRSIRDWAEEGLDLNAIQKRLHEDLGIKLENVGIEDLGQAKRVVVSKDETVIVEGAGKSADIEGRISQIRHQIKDTTSDYDREKLQERLAKLAGGVAVIHVGAATETEMKEKKARVDLSLIHI